MDTGEARASALERQLEHYLYTAQEGIRLMDPQLAPLELPPLASRHVRPEVLADLAGARAWFTAEHAVLLGVIRQASAAGFDRACWQLAYAVKTYLYWSGQWADWVVTQTAALRAAQRLGDLVVQAHTHRSLGKALDLSGRQDEAEAHFKSALELFAAVRDPQGGRS
ncbi:hypothetical protein J7E97_26390 [Streptomyces sp. ISL-66]|uniref:hypothetical protein n=1 Tax=Streptomyces sp. ISL-66 TaxID=2819186 RepID=UPI001BEAD4E2|nr:hypothetical protein [Streptomyces sp. ISL-66]MBT2471293.1 hypothetical protein [Streptomyces sp. ISL-66]